MRRARQTAALDVGQAAADAVHVLDGQARPQQQPVDCDLVHQGQRRAGRDHQRRPPARDQRQHQVVRPRPARDLQDLARGGLGCGVGGGVGRLADGDALRRNAVAVPRDDDARQVDIGPGGLQRGGHGGGGFARAHHDAAPLGPGRQMVGQHAGRVRGRNRRVEHRAQQRLCLIGRHLMSLCPPGPRDGPEGWGTRGVPDAPSDHSAQAWMAARSGPFGVRPRLNGAEASRQVEYSCR